ncbi:hypothetical protein NPIL_337331 [Nephila pilipes]|uniref:Uncharacterized protein n=1 Tax=Nephila pilipes TaxID=299642 RepID=A0A8X6PVC4_NEPPI|nr:hypothetical protein NPIL_337331 [Nephila pilipes]
MNKFSLSFFSLSDLDSTRWRLNSASELVLLLRAKGYAAFNRSDNPIEVTYNNSVSVHVRRFKKYGKTYYPTSEGITLAPWWIEYIMGKKKVPESQEELPSGLFPPERHIKISSENFADFTFRRIKYGLDKEPTFKEIIIFHEQWAEMNKSYGAIGNNVIDNMFQCTDFFNCI